MTHKHCVVAMGRKCAKLLPIWSAYSKAADCILPDLLHRELILPRPDIERVTFDLLLTSSDSGDSFDIVPVFPNHRAAVGDNGILQAYASRIFAQPYFCR